MSTAVQGPAGADEASVRRHARALMDLGAAHGVTTLRYASRGRLVGHLANDRDAFDGLAFEEAAAALLGAPVELYSDAVLTKANVSADLTAAREL